MKLYSFLETTLLINGREMTGFDQSDDSIIVRRLEDSMGHVVGNKGEMAAFVRGSKAGEVVFKLQQTSDDNTFLSALIAAAENGAFIPVAFMYKDNLGNDIVTGNKGYIRRPADMQRGTPVGSQAWGIVVERMDILHGGGLEV